jgi:hypothetical protein
MRRLLVILVCVAFAACSSGGGDDKPAAQATSTTSTLPIAQMQAKASQLTDLLIAGKWDDVVAEFNAEMHIGLTSAGLKTAWEQVVATYGAYKSRGTTARSLTAAPPGIVVFDTPLTFGSEASKSRISLDADSKVAGLFILKATVP